MISFLAKLLSTYHMSEWQLVAMSDSHVVNLDIKCFNFPFNVQLIMGARRVKSSIINVGNIYI